MRLQIKPTDPNVIQVWDDKQQTWLDWFGGFPAVNKTTQPGSGAQQPTPGGGIVQYPATMQASGKWLVPYPVNTGDTLELVDASGAGNDGSGAAWRCPDGDVFFAGVCVDLTQALAGTDPMPAVGHMRLIFDIGGTKYDAMSGPVTVPSGVANQQVYVQVNDSILGDNAGAYTFTVHVTNNAVGSWSHVLDLQTGMHHFALQASQDACTGARGNYRAGVGFETIQEGGPEDGCIRYMYCGAQYYWTTPTEIDSVDLEYDCSYASVGGDPFELRLSYLNAATTVVTAQSVEPPVTGNGLHLRLVSPVTATGLQFFLWTGDHATDSAHLGYARAYRLTVSGRGFDPFA